ncbi:MAG: hypothetical protein C5B49_08805 [Bdellovibrio sp.]|nr:MAG: hypothetical protein C5B49_08805 [Bdellovibrio sp.]
MYGSFIFPLLSHAIDVPSTVTAVRLRNGITGGLMPFSDPLFPKMVSKVAAGDIYGAALLAADSNYFGSSLGRRLALQMQTPSLDSTGIQDNDASAFLLAHFIGAGGSVPRISTIWSESATYLVVDPNGNTVHAADLSTQDLANVDWTQMVRLPGQQDANGTFILVQHVGGYTTLSDRPDDGSFAIYGATAGTNLRMIEGIWEIATGLTLLDVASVAASPQQAPRFVPEYDPNFFVGQNQQACISCHGGGMSSLNHGYATVANIFDVTDNGFVFNPNPTTAMKKSLGSNPRTRNSVLTCNLTRVPTPVCNPESPDVDPNQTWDLSQVWAKSGVLTAMGWQGPTTGQGLQSLGYAIGQSWIVYQFLTQRVISELCPLGSFSTAEVNAIAAAANPWADPAGTDDLRTIVAKVASSPGCL